MSREEPMSITEIAASDDEPEGVSFVGFDSVPERSSWLKEGQSGWGTSTVKPFAFGTRLRDQKLPPPNKVARRGDMDYKKMGKLARASPTKIDYLRNKGTTTSANADIYDDLINIILNAKRDIVRVEGLDDYENAQDYAKKRGLRTSKRETDINHDGVNDVILYNKRGMPVIVNGYKLVPSKQPLRKMYHKDKREGNLEYPAEGLKGYTKQLYGVRGDWDEDGNREVDFDSTNLPESLRNLKFNGWRIPPAPKKKQSIRNRLTKLMKQTIEKFMSVNDGLQQRSWLMSILPKFKMYQYLYTAIVDYVIWTTELSEDERDAIRQQVDDINSKHDIEGDVTVYDAFKAYKESHSKRFNQYLETEYPNIVEACLSEPLRFVDQLAALFVNMGITVESCAEIPPDSEIDNMEPDELKELKERLKLQANHGIEVFKELAISKFE